MEGRGGEWNLHSTGSLEISDNRTTETLNGNQVIGQGHNMEVVDRRSPGGDISNGGEMQLNRLGDVQ